ncbi:MAG: septum formation initiator family protein [Bacteroidota bacterium]|nr:septum formation initiator family protein [Bacteroidota bacterium]
MKLIKKIPAWLKSKFLLTAIAFLAWMLFFDRNDFLTQRLRTNELRELQQSKQYYTDQIFTEKAELELLKSNPATLEKYAREKYYMKRDNEELFLIPENRENPKN